MIDIVNMIDRLRAASSDEERSSILQDWHDGRRFKPKARHLSKVSLLADTGFDGNRLRSMLMEHYEYWLGEDDLTTLGRKFLVDELVQSIEGYRKDQAAWKAWNETPFNREPAFLSPDEAGCTLP